MSTRLYGRVRHSWRQLQDLLRDYRMPPKLSTQSEREAFIPFPTVSIASSLWLYECWLGPCGYVSEDPREANSRQKQGEHAYGQQHPVKLYLGTGTGKRDVVKRN